MLDHKTFRYLKTLFVLTLIWGVAACGSSPSQPQPKATKAEPEMAAHNEPDVTIAEPAYAEASDEPVEIQRDHPDRYVVVKGDTLWDISARFLKSPWLWPEVWHINPNIRNPHLIYPGDVVVLHYVDGKPYLTLEGQAGITPPVPKGMKTVKLSPQIRTEPLQKSISTIPRSAIEPFLFNHRVVSRQTLKSAPYIVSTFEQHLVAGSGETIYVRNLKNPQVGGFQVVREGKIYTHPDTGEILGYEAENLAESRLIREGKAKNELASLTITRTFLEVLNGDKLLPMERRERSITFLPKEPDQEVNGHIISVLKGVGNVGRHDVVVVTLGAREGMQSGDVLAIYQQGKIVRDIFANGEPVKLPAERAGLLMIFRVFDKVSYGLVMEAERALHVLDTVHNP